VGRGAFKGPRRSGLGQGAFRGSRGRRRGTHTGLRRARPVAIQWGERLRHGGARVARGLVVVHRSGLGFEHVAQFVGDLQRLAVQGRLLFGRLVAWYRLGCVPFGRGCRVFDLDRQHPLGLFLQNGWRCPSEPIASSAFHVFVADRDPSSLTRPQRGWSALPIFLLVPTRRSRVSCRWSSAPKRRLLSIAHALEMERPAEHLIEAQRAALEAEVR
jgi:hypothetical protein